MAWWVNLQLIRIHVSPDTYIHFAKESRIDENKILGTGRLRIGKIEAYPQSGG
jgi:hypothetical protein